MRTVAVYHTRWSVAEYLGGNDICSIHLICQIKLQVSTVHLLVRLVAKYMIMVYNCQVRILNLSSCCTKHRVK